MNLSELQENPNNPRIIKDDKFQKLVKSIKEFPEMLEARPIVVNPDNIVLGGNMRLKACKAAGLKEAPVYVASWEESKANEFIVKDNVGFGEWDWDILANEWDATQLEEWGLDVWTPEEEEVEGLTDPDEVPSVPEEPKTKLGDLYILGEHRLLCGDSTKAEDVEKLLKGENADTLITDPPYGINANNQTLGSGKKQFHRGGDWDKSRPEITALLDLANTQIIWGGNYFSDVLSPTNDWLCWHKKNDGLSFSEFELAWTNLGKNCRLLSHHWGGESKLHPTMKPVAVMEWCVKMTEGTIFDPFLGSGSTLIASEKTGRKCYGMELDPKYCDVIVKRWEDFTGKKAELWKP
jgi:hypothetical protein